MIKVGLVGEDPNDTLSIKNLLEQRYKAKVKFYQLAKRIKGFQLDNPKIRKSLPIEFADKKCKFIVYIRDLDAFKSEDTKLRAKVKWFKDLDAFVNKEGVLLLNIWELEALILGDIDTFNKLYNVNHKFTKDPMFQKEPKELLKKITAKEKKQYKENNCPKLFEHLDIDQIENKCKFFKNFLQEFDAKIG